MLLSVTPAVVTRGETVVITGYGVGTDFTTLSDVSVSGGQPSGITVNSFAPVSDTEFTAEITVSESAPIQLLDVTATTAAGSVTLDRGLRAVPSTLSIASIVSVSPAVVRRGDCATVAIVGDGTNFLDGQTTVDLGPGVTVTAVNVLDPMNLTATVQVGVTAPIAFRNVVVSTGSEQANVVNGFYVDEAAGITTLTADATQKVSRVLPACSAVAFEVNLTDPRTIERLFIATYGSRTDGLPPTAIVEIVGPAGAVIATLDTVSGRIDGSAITLPAGISRIYIYDPSGLGGAFKGVLQLGD